MTDAKEILKKFPELFNQWETSIVGDEWEKASEEIYNYFPELCKNFLFGECVRVIGLLQTAQQHGKNVEWKKIVDVLNAIFREMPKSDREILFPIYFKLGEKAVSPLLELLKDVEAKDQRIQIIEILKNIFAKSPELLPKLLDTTNEPWYLVRNLILIAGEVGVEELAPHLERFISYDNEKVKKELAEALIKIKGINAVPYLTKLLLEKNPIVRKGVVELLLRYQLWSTVAAENILFAMRNSMDRVNDEDEESFVRVSVSYLTNALSHLHNPERALKGLITLLKMYGKKSLIPGRKSKIQTGVLSTLLNSLSGIKREKLQPFMPALEESTNIKELLSIINKLKTS